MEVASNSSSLLLPSNHHLPRVPPLPQQHSPRMASSPPVEEDEHSRDPHDHRHHENGHSRLSDSSLMVDVEIPSSSASEATECSPAMLTLTPPPENEHDKEPSGISPASNGVTAKKVRRSGGPDDGSRKSRITRLRDDPADIVNNYVDSSDIKQVCPRVVPPIGAYRRPFHMPKMDLEKEKDKLKINMVGPKTKTIVDSVDDLLKKKRAYQILVGDEYQAKFEDFYLEDYQGPRSSREEIEDRDQEMWFDDRVKLKDKERELDDCWTAVRRQFGGKIGIDSMLRRLMLCNYDIDDMLINIEKEFFEHLPQPFEELNEAQQAEFERLLRKNGGTGGHPNGKVFRHFQEKFMKSYYLGEIVNYYYDTKHKGCLHQLYHRCECRDKWINELHPWVPRYECVNCTRYLIGNEKSHRSFSLCAICEIYHTRNRRHRVPAAKLTEPDEKIALAWLELERLKAGQPVTRNEVLQYIEDQRREKLNVRAAMEEVPTQYIRNKPIKLSPAELYQQTKKFKVRADPKCSIIHPWGKKLRQYTMADFSKEDRCAIIRAIEKHQNRWHLVAEEAGKSEAEVKAFYRIFNENYRLDRIANPPRKDMWFIQPSAFTISAENSNSPTPEPPTRRKRPGSDDPSYTERREIPPPKTTRRTRQATAAAQAGYESYVQDGH